MDGRSLRYKRDQEFKESVERNNDFEVNDKRKGSPTDSEKVFDEYGNSVKGASLNCTGVPYFRKAGSQFASLTDDEL